MGLDTDHLDEFGILHHHCVDDTKEALIRREESNTASEGISLHETLTQVFTENLDNPAIASIGELIPLEVAAGVVKHSVKFIALQFIRREYPHAMGVVDKDLVNESAN